MVTLIVWTEGKTGIKRKLEIQCESHQEANKLVRSEYTGMKTKIVNMRFGAKYNEGLRSVSHAMLAEHSCYG